MNKQIVYIPTGNARSGYQLHEGYNNYSGNLAEIEGYFFTTEELKQVLSDAFDAGAFEDYEDVSFNGGEDYEKVRIKKIKEVYIENFLNKEK